MSFLFTLLLMVIFFKVTGFCLRIFGKLLGCIFGLFGYVLIGVLAITGLGLAVAFFPVIILVGIMAIIAAVARVA